MTVTVTNLLTLGISALVIVIGHLQLGAPGLRQCKELWEEREEEKEGEGERESEKRKRGKRKRKRTGERMST